MKKPCRECPFKRNSAPGWLGEHESVNEIIDMIYADHPFPCHMDVNEIIHRSIDEDNPIDFDEAFHQGEHCHGALIFMNNSAKISMNKSVAAMQKEAGKDTESIFNWRHEAVKHHGTSHRVPGPKLNISAES